MNLLWFSVVVAIAIVAMAAVWVRRVNKRLERLSQSYWELRYEQGQLNARVGRLEPLDDQPSAPADAAPPKPAQFVPLSSLRK